MMMMMVVMVMMTVTMMIKSVANNGDGHGDAVYDKEVCD